MAALLACHKAEDNNGLTLLYSVLPADMHVGMNAAGLHCCSAKACQEQKEMCCCLL